MVPALVDRQGLAHANAALEAADSICGVIGSALAGVRISLSTALLWRST
jgi:hypothetical protein